MRAVHLLDTGELLFGSAIGYDWMYDALTVGMFNWESVASMKPLSEAVVFTIEHFKG